MAAAALFQGAALFEPARKALQARQYRVGDQDLTRLHYLLFSNGLIDATQVSGLPSTQAVPPGVLDDGLPTISLVSPEEGLYCPDEGIFTHPTEKGRRWERPLTISYFENGQLRYETHAGLRIHGGQSRKGEIKSFQVIFRRTYSGAPRAAAGVFFGGESPPIQRLVLSNTNKVKRFLNPLAYDIAESVGCITSRHAPVRVFLNGERVRSGYFMIEHQSREFLKHRFGHDDFDWVRLKGNSRPSLSLDLLSSWVNSPESKVDMQSAGRRFDLEDLCAWIFAVTFCDTRDEDQGGYFRDNRYPDALWRTVVWDMDGSFNHGEPPKKQLFEFDEIRGLRGRLFHRLCESDPAFRAHYRQYAERMLKEKVAPDQIRALTERYKAIVRTGLFEPRCNELLETIDGTGTFLLERHALYLAKLDAYYAKLGPM